MVLVIEDVEHVWEKRVDVCELGELVDYGAELFFEGLAAEFYFFHVEGSDSVYGVAWVDFGWGLSLGFREDYVDDLVRGMDGLDVFEVVEDWHL